MARTKGSKKKTKNSENDFELMDEDSDLDLADEEGEDKVEPGEAFEPCCHWELKEKDNEQCNLIKKRVLCHGVNKGCIFWKEAVESKMSEFRKDVDSFDSVLIKKDGADIDEDEDEDF